MRDALYDACRRLDVKTAGRAYRDTADVSPCFLAFRYDGTYAVPGLESVNAFFASQVASRKALCSEACALVTAATGASDFQRRSLPSGDSLDFANTRCIECVSLRNLQPCAIPLRPPAATGLERQFSLLQCVEWRPARAVDGGRITQRRLRFRQNPREPCLVLDELPHVAPALADVAGRAAKRQVRHPIRAAACTRKNVLDLQRHTRGVAVGALAPPLLEKIFTYLVPEQLSLLILDTGDFRVLHRLHVQAHQLHRQRRHRCPAHDAPDPRHRRIDPMLKAWREPARSASPVVEPGCAITQVGAAPAAPECASLRQCFANLSAAVNEVHQVQHGDAVCFLLYQRYACCLTARVKLEPQRLKRRVLGPSVSQPDNEGHNPMHPCPTALQ